MEFFHEYEACNNEQGRIAAYIFADKQALVGKTLLTQTADLTGPGEKIDTFKRIQRFMPYDYFEHMHMNQLK